MSDSFFDGSTGATAQADMTPPQQPEAAAPEPQHVGGLDMLDMLREQTDARDDSVAPELVAVPIPALGWRLMCNPDFSFPQYQSWQKASLPVKMRNGRKAPNPIDLDQAALALLVLTETCEAVEYRNGNGGWHTLEHNGEALTVKHQEFLSKFNMVDPKSMVRKLFTPPGKHNADAELIRAGQLVIEKSGYGDNGEDDDPLE